MSRVSSAASLKGLPGSAQRIPQVGTKLRELWDLLHVYRGEVIVDDLTMRYRGNQIEQLRDFYGLDIRNLGATSRNGRGQGRGPSRWVLAGEWIGPRYVDYIAERLKKETRR